MNKVFSNMYMGANNPEIETGCKVIEATYEDIKLTNYVEQVTNRPGNSEGYKHRDNVLATLREVATVCDKVMSENGTMITVGGDHSLAAASVAVANEAIDNMGLIWIDAHADINDEKITNSGHIHGMPVAFLMGDGEADFINLIERNKMVKPENIVYFATRDVEPEEAAVIDKYGIKEISWKQIAEVGFEAAMNEAVEYLQSKVTNLHISYDIDSGEPKQLPGVTTPVKGGITTEETLILIEKLLTTFNVKTADIVEYNPIKDKENKTLTHFKNVYDLMDKHITE